MSQEYCSGTNINWRNSNRYRIKALAAFIAFAGPVGQALAMDVPKPTDKWTQLEVRGREATDANQYWIAEPNLLEALSLAQRFDGHDLRLAKNLGDLGRLYNIRGDYDKAESYFQQEYKIEDWVFGEDVGDLVPAMASLITFYMDHDKIAKAEPVTEDLILLVEGQLRSPNSSTKTTVKFEKGAPLEGWAGNAAPIARDKLVQCAVACDNLGDLYRQHNNFEVADRLYKAALDLKATVFGKQHISLANSYDRIGNLCVAKNEMKDGESYLKDSLEITEKVLPPEDPHVYARIDQLAKCYVKEGKNEQAEALYIRAQDLWKNCEEPPKYGEPCRAAYALGSLYSDEKKYEQAAPYLQQALEQSEQFNGPDSFNLIPYLQRYAYVLYYLGKKADSDQLKARAAVISGGEQIAGK